MGRVVFLGSYPASMLFRRSRLSPLGEFDGIYAMGTVIVFGLDDPRILIGLGRFDVEIRIAPQTIGSRHVLVDERALLFGEKRPCLLVEQDYRNNLE